MGMGWWWYHVDINTAPNFTHHGGTYPIGNTVGTMCLSNWQSSTMYLSNWQSSTYHVGTIFASRSHGGTNTIVFSRVRGSIIEGDTWPASALRGGAQSAALKTEIRGFVLYVAEGGKGNRIFLASDYNRIKRTRAALPEVLSCPF